MILDLIFSNTFGSKLPSMNLKIYDDSKNYVCQVINLPAQVAVPGLDNLVKVTIQGNDCLIKKDPIGGKYLFFPSESQISHEFLSNNNLYRDPQLNVDKTQKGFFEENRRVKAMKFKGVISSGFVIPINSLKFTDTDIPGIGWDNYDVGMEFNEINGVEICRKYIPKGKQKGSANTPKQNKVIHDIVESKFVPEHIDTVHLLKEISKIDLNAQIAISVKIHGCVSADTIIETLEFGNKTIKEIVECKLNCRIKAFDTSNNEIIYVPINDFYLKLDHGEWFEIELEDGKKIKITSNNPVWLPELNCYRETKDLKVGDYLLID